MTTTDAYTMRTTQDYTLFTLRDNLDRQDRERFKSLCAVFGCYRAPDFKRFTLTPVRGQKLDRLFRAGFVGHETYFRHPAIPSRRFSTKEATNVLSLATFIVDSIAPKSIDLPHVQDNTGQAD